jgi:hypothetical protein
MKESPIGMTPNEFARKYRVAAQKVITWIGAGHLKAVDLRSPGVSKPRWLILPEHEQAFLSSRASTPLPQQQRRRRAIAGSVHEYF